MISHSLNKSNSAVVKKQKGIKEENGVEEEVKRYTIAKGKLNEGLGGLMDLVDFG